MSIENDGDDKKSPVAEEEEAEILDNTERGRHELVEIIGKLLAWYFREQRREKMNRFKKKDEQKIHMACIQRGNKDADYNEALSEFSTDCGRLLSSKLISSDWDKVTCRNCLRHKPKNA